MDLTQLRCFITAAEELHFGRAAQRMEMLPASLGRQIKQLENHLNVRLFLRTTRAVNLTEAGQAILEDARALIAQADAMEQKARTVAVDGTRALRVGAIDSAAAGLMPQLLRLLRDERPGLDVHLIEQKTIHLLPKLLSGSIDLAFCRPPDVRDPRVVFRTLFHETAVVALPDAHRLAGRKTIPIQELADEPLIVPDRRSRPHSHDLTIKLFIDAGMTARIAQVAEEKHTIVTFVAAGTGLAIVPSWTSRLRVPGVSFVPLDNPEGKTHSKLILAVAWTRGTRDPMRDAFLEVLENNLEALEATA